MTELVPCSIQTIGIVVKPNHPMVRPYIRQIEQWCAQKKIKMFYPQEQPEPPANATLLPRREMMQIIDLLLVLGGDGTMISVTRDIENREIPVLGIHLGTVGYLMEFTCNEIFWALERYLRGELALSRRMVLSCEVYREGKRVDASRALNDVVVAGSGISRLIELECKIDDQYVTNVRSDGLILATPTGSTGYSLSAGGPLLLPYMEAICMTPICSISLTNRPIVLEGKSQICLKILTGFRDQVLVTLDGQHAIRLQKNDEVWVRKSAQPFLLIQTPQKNHFQVFREKLGWSGDFHHLKKNSELFPPSVQE